MEESFLAFLRRRLSKPLTPRERLLFAGFGAISAAVAIAGAIEERLFLTPQEGQILRGGMMVLFASVPAGFELAWAFGSLASVRRVARFAPLLIVALLAGSAVHALVFPPLWGAAVPLLGIVGVRAQQRVLREERDSSADRQRTH